MAPRTGLITAGIALIALASGCATAPKIETPAPPQTPPIDLLAIQHDLGLDASSERVGYREKRFDACRFSAQLPEVPDCSHVYFIQIGVQLSCRPPDAEDSSVLEQADLTPVSERELRWNLDRLSGRTRTDMNGFGLILAIAPRSMKLQGLKVSTGEDFLLIRAGKATDIVTPASWCLSQERDVPQ
jgi:hypothetical protein